MAEKQWTGTTYGSGLMHRWLIRLLRVVDIRIVYAFTCVFVIPFFLFRPSFKYIYRYFRDRWGMSAVCAFRNACLNHYLFSQVVIDRFAMYGGRRFHFDIEGYEHYTSLSSLPAPFVQLSAHIGNYEVAGYALSPEKPINALVFDGEKQSVMENRSHMFADKKIRMIPVSQDMSHLFLIDRALQAGEIVSMPADRIFGSPKSVAVNLLGAPAQLPLGPFSVVSMRGLDALAVHVMKRSTEHYVIYVTPLRYDKQAPRHQQIQQLAQAYADTLQRMLTMYPTQWYNFFDFWNNHKNK